MVLQAPQHTSQHGIRVNSNIGMNYRPEQTRNKHGRERRTNATADDCKQVDEASETKHGLKIVANLKES